MMFLAQAHGFESVSRLGDNIQTGGLQEAPQTASDDAVIVSQQHAQVAPPESAAVPGDEWPTSSHPQALVKLSPSPRGP